MGPITYQLLIELRQPLRLQIGRLGLCDFAAGRYIYTGSARRNFEARVARHLSPTKRLHWHIDYLLTAPGVAVVDVRRYVEDECAINRATPGSVPIPGFGASDCRAGCGGHLKRMLP
ncbi:MAG TPA: GIY-YIG nuclease family protein [Rhodocyclaceae bacterium]